MATNLAIDDRLIEAARRVGRHKTRKAAVIAALEEYIAYRKQLTILESFGKVEYYPEYSYKRMRRRKRDWHHYATSGRWIEVAF